MKKLILITTLLGLTGLGALAQGTFIFGTSGSYVWNGAAGTRGGSYNVSFLIDTANTSAPAVASMMASTPTNAAAAFGGGNPWTSILNDPNYSVASNFASSTAVVGTLSGAGGVIYNGGNSFTVSGTAAAGGTAKVYIIAWDNAYATPALAAAANASVGWSLPFLYQYNNGVPAPANFSTQAANAAINSPTVSGQFGVSPIAGVPEPATFALAGLGMAAMLIARRRK